MALMQFSNKNKHGNTRTRLIYSDSTSIGFNPTGFGSSISVRTFKYDYEHAVMPPHLFVDQEGNKYIVPSWKKVHSKTELKDINWIKPKIKKQENKKWKFKSSSSDKEYTVTQVDSNTLRCTCPGSWRAKREVGCKHVQKVRASLTK
jgi:hypothetical protein|tara:strand:+ start:818 stop:1258 length:441 start_codon:yes stop_codon:yes gene_type:complete